MRPVSQTKARAWLSPPGMCAALAASSRTCTDSKPMATADDNACSPRAATGLHPNGVASPSRAAHASVRPYALTRQPHAAAACVEARVHHAEVEREPTDEESLLGAHRILPRGQPNVSSSQPHPSGGARRGMHTARTGAWGSHVRDGERGRNHLQRLQPTLLLVWVGSECVGGGVHVHLATA